MANRAKMLANNAADVKFPPEADTDFDQVSVEEIAAWNQKLRDQYGIGKGKLAVIEDVTAAG